MFIRNNKSKGRRRRNNNNTYEGKSRSRAKKFLFFFLFERRRREKICVSFINRINKFAISPVSKWRKKNQFYQNIPMTNSTSLQRH